MREIKKKFSFYSILKSFSSALDLVSTEIIGHHRQTTYIALVIAQEMGLSKDEIKKLLTASLIHDIGIFYLDQNLDDLSFDKDDNNHALVGYYLLKDSFPVKDVAKILRYHHLRWSDYQEINNKEYVSDLSHILFLADRISTLLLNRSPKDILIRYRGIAKIIRSKSGQYFKPEAVKAFNKIAQKEYFWLMAVNSNAFNQVLEDYFADCSYKIDIEEFIKLSQLISHIIDFRSPFTATHSDGVAVIARETAAYMGFDKEEQKIFQIAGFLHDIGKLAIPLDILNKEGSLNNKEWSIMKSHSYYSYYILDQSKELQDIKEWASYHHERLNGKGYPFHLKGESLSIPARIMAVVDVFTAITEERPYRKGMDIEQSKQVLEDLSNKNMLDKKIVRLILDHFHHFNTLRKETQKNARAEFDSFKELIEEEVLLKSMKKKVV